MTQRGAMGGPPVQPDGMSPSGARSPSSRPADLPYLLRYPSNSKECPFCGRLMSAKSRRCWDCRRAQTQAGKESVTSRLLRRSRALSGGCWEWQGQVLHGYGRLKINGRSIRAHRASYETFVGSIPHGLTLDHLCRNKLCINPWHLDPVTSRVNVFRAPTAPATLNAAKTHCKRGHAFSQTNTYRRPAGGRDCRECKRARRSGEY